MSCYNSWYILWLVADSIVVKKVVLKKFMLVEGIGVKGTPAVAIGRGITFGIFIVIAGIFAGVAYYFATKIQNFAQS